MSQPVTYDRVYNFSEYQALHPTTPLPAAQVDLELNTIKITLDQTLANLAIIQRDDGQLANNSVGFDQLRTDVATGVQPATTWATATSYTIYATVFFGLLLYRSLASHISGVFATDLAAGKWLQIADFSFATAEGLSLVAGGGGAVTLTPINDIGAIEALSSTGFAVRTATDTWVQRTIAGTAAEITVTNDSGVSGNPTLSLPAALTFTGKTVTGGAFTGGTLNNAVVGGTTPAVGSFTAANILPATDNVTFLSVTAGGNARLVGSLDASGNVRLRTQNTVSLSLGVGNTDWLTINNAGVVSMPGTTLANFAATTSAQLASVLSDETGTGSVVFSVSPALTGTPTAPTAANGTNTTQLASTAFVQNTVAGATAGVSLFGGATGIVTVSGGAVMLSQDLRTERPILAKSANYTVVAADRAAMFVLTSTATLALTAAATLGTGFYFTLRNTNATSGLWTIDPNASETIDGKTTLTVGLGEEIDVFCDGAAFYTSAPRGRLVELVRQVASASATIDFDFASGFPADFDEFEVHVVAGVPATDDSYLHLRIKTSGALTVQSGGSSYVYGGRIQGAGGGADYGSTADAIGDRIAIGRTGSTSRIGNASGEFISGVLKFTKPNATMYPSFTFFGGYSQSGNDSWVGLTASGYYGGATAITGLQLAMNSGNVTSGDFVLYGVRK